MTDDEERTLLEQVIAGNAKPTLGPAATAGRLAELYLAVPDRVARAPAALGLVRTALDAMGQGNATDPLYPKLRHFEAMALRLIDLAQAPQAAAIDREAWQISLERAPGEAIIFAAQWANWAWDNDRLDEAGEAYAKAHRALRRFVRRQVGDERDRLDVQQYTTYASRGAFALATTGREQDAVILLERASDLVFGTNADRDFIQRLRTTDPALAARLEAAMTEQRTHQGTRGKKFGLDAVGNQSAAALAAQTALDTIVLEVRQRPGFATFALPSGWPDIAEAALNNTLVYLAPTTKGTVACIVHGDDASSARLCHGALEASISDIYAAAKPFLDAEFGGTGADAHAPLLQLLVFLGDAIMAPVLGLLSHLELADRSYTLLPFGMLSNLPLGAAVLPPPAPGRLRPLCTPQHVRFAYSSRALAASRMTRSSPPTSALVVSNPLPLPASLAPLQLAAFEAAMVSGHVTATVLAGFAAAAGPVLDGLAASDLIHFACHGTVEQRLGYAGVLILARRQELTYRDLRRCDRLRAQLVVLAACRSGVSGIAIEHPLSLPASFLAAGARAVIGSLWRADDMATLLLMTRFYALWPETLADPATALARAIEWLRFSPAADLRAAIPAEALATPAAATLNQADAATPPYADPWFWAGFFLAGWSQPSDISA